MKTPFGIVGCGQMGKAHLAGYLLHPQAEVVAFCDEAIEKAKRLAQEEGKKVYSSFREMLERENLAGISLCTPPSTHREIALEAIRKKVAVLCEKPLAREVKEGEEMIKEAEKRGVLLMTAFKFRFFPQVERAKKIVQKGEIGKIILLRNNFGAWVNMKEKWRRSSYR